MAKTPTLKDDPYRFLKGLRQRSETWFELAGALDGFRELLDDYYAQLNRKAGRGPYDQPGSTTQECYEQYERLMGLVNALGRACEHLEDAVQELVPIEEAIGHFEIDHAMEAWHAGGAAI